MFKFFKFKKKPNLKSKPKNPESTVSGVSESRFVVHERRDASRIIHNFGMEMKDEKTGEIVLKTWTIPKNLPLEEEVKHLAIQIDDQPVTNSAFKKKLVGDIAGGQIKIWDKGRWGLMQGKISEGSLSFNLLGEKARGRFGMMIAKNFPENDKGNKGEGRHWLVWKKGV